MGGSSLSLMMSLKDKIWAQEEAPKDVWVQPREHDDLGVRQLPTSRGERPQDTASNQHLDLDLQPPESLSELHHLWHFVMVA